MNDDKSADNPVEISKSQRKRDAQELLDLAKKLVAMPQTRLSRMPMDADLLEAVRFTRNIHAHGARKRQLMTVGKMLRNRDNEDLLDAVNDFDRKNRRHNARHHHIEAWRDKLLVGNKQDIEALLRQYPDMNVQTLRQLIRNANKEAKLNKPPGSARKLFKLLREVDEQHPLPPG